MRLFWDKLNPKHNKAAFSSGIPDLDDYLRLYASQDAKRFLASVYVLSDANGQIVGYYAISQDSLTVQELPEDARKNLPSKRKLACTLLGRLAVDARHQGQGYGRELLFHALKKAAAVSEEIASFAVLVDAKNDAAKAFYQKYDFFTLVDAPLRLFLPIKGLKYKMSFWANYTGV